MVPYSEKTLANGLKVICNYDPTSPLVAVNTLYKVGSRDERATKTGLAHLFEHLMFSGSKNIEDFDTPLQAAGGENNAFTNCDITNYYDILPAENIETALWLESDRMGFLDLSEENVRVQKKVVLEEFLETCLNRPYGDLWHHVSDLCYTKYPYKWPTIGFNPDHISDIKRSDCLAFYDTFYHPSNASLTFSGNIEDHKAFELADKWFSDLKAKEIKPREYPKDERQQSARSKIVYGQVPTPSILIAFPMADRSHSDYYRYDLLSDIWGYGKTATFYKKYVLDEPKFSSLSIYISGTQGPGLFIIEGKPAPGVTIEECKDIIWSEIHDQREKGIAGYDLEKVKNSLLSHMAFSETSILNKAMSLAYFDSIGDTALINDQMNAYMAVTAEDLNRIIREKFTLDQSNEVIYLPLEK